MFHFFVYIQAIESALAEFREESHSVMAAQQQAMICVTPNRSGSLTPGARTPVAGQPPAVTQQDVTMMLGRGQ